MKQKLILVLSIVTLSFASCDEGFIKPADGVDSAPVPRISSFYPESGVPGTTVAIFGENFGTSISDNDVTFNGMYSDVMQVQTGTIIVRVPSNLAQGDYKINLWVRSQTVTSSGSFRVNEDSTNK